MTDETKTYLLTKHAQLLFLLAPALSCISLTADDTVVFRRDKVEPILQARCLECHGPDEREPDFRVDRNNTIGGGRSSIETIILEGF